MAYKTPGAYARFVNAPTPVSDPREVRALAIIGTGEVSYPVVNEFVARSTIGISDVLQNKNVYRIDSLNSKPLYSGSPSGNNNTTYMMGNYVVESVDPAITTDWGQEISTYRDIEGGHYTIVDGQYVVWKLAIDTASIADTDFGNLQITPGLSEGSKSFAVYSPENTDRNVDVQINTDKLYLLKNATYKFEVTYPSQADGLYTVIDVATNDIVGEFVVNPADYDEDIIPGLKIKIYSTSTDFTDVNDYFTLTVTAPTADLSVDDVATPTAYYASYTFTKDSSQYVPKVFTSYDDIVKEYGNYEVAANGSVINSLALGAEIAMRNGASPIVCMQVRNNTETAFKNAIDALGGSFVGIRNINAVVALTDGLTPTAQDNVSDYLKNHVETLSVEDVSKERIAFVSPTKTDDMTKIVNDEDYIPNMRFNSERVVFVFSHGATKEITSIRSTKPVVRNLAADYVTVAVAALSLKNDVAEPLTNKALVGFQNLIKLYTESEMTQLAVSGCLVVKQEANVIRVRHGITTSDGDINSSEITLIQIKDYVIDNVRLVLGETYIGNKLKPSILGDIKSTLITILNGYRGRSIILGYSGLSVKKSDRDSREVLVSFQIEAVYPLNYIDITFSFSGVN